MINRKEKRWIDMSRGDSKLFGVNIGWYPSHHFTVVPAPLQNQRWPLQIVSTGFDIMCEGVFRQRENSDVCSFELVNEGEILYESNGVAHQCLPGDMFVLHLHSNNRMECVSPTAKFSCVGFDGTLLEEILTELHLAKVDFIRLKSPQLFEEKFNTINEMAQHPTPDAPMKIATAGYELLLQISQEATSHNVLPALLQKIVAYFQHNINQALRIGDVAEHFKVSQGTIFGMFRRHMDTTPTEYLTQLRMQYASRLLRESEFSIKEIAAKCGYENQMYFSLVFKQRFGIPPGKFRRT